MIILRLTRNKGFTLSLEDTLFKKLQWEGEDQIDPLAVLALNRVLVTDVGNYRTESPY